MQQANFVTHKLHMNAALFMHFGVLRLPADCVHQITRHMFYGASGQIFPQFIMEYLRRGAVRFQISAIWNSNPAPRGAVGLLGNSV